MAREFDRTGWLAFPYDPVLADWARHALPAAREAVKRSEDPRGLRCGGTWFVGVNALPNDGRGKIGGGPPLAGTAVDFIADLFPGRTFDLDRGQVSVCYPGYPQPSDQESAAAFRFRRDRDAAHLDGLLPEGPDRRRHLREHHAYLLGIPLTESDPGAAPLVVWEGSHKRVHAAFSGFFKDIAPADWGASDVTEIYHAVRRQVFEECRRVAIPARPGEAYLVHRLAIHGVAPWAENAGSGPDGRMIVYFRPEFPDPADWLADF
ncbi:MAG: hypothetical protein AAGL24_06865 [Pseudomonadota bacterium]